MGHLHETPLSRLEFTLLSRFRLKHFFVPPPPRKKKEREKKVIKEQQKSSFVHFFASQDPISRLRFQLGFN